MSNEMFRLSNKVALITGAATGLGAAISIVLAKTGAHVAISDKPGVSLDDTAVKAGIYGHRVFKVGIDVRELGQIREGVVAAEKEFGRIDILVNNAGINRATPGLEVTEDNWDDHFNTNVKGGFFMAQAAAKGMGADYFYCEPVRIGWYPRTACILFKQRCGDSVDPHSWCGMG
jgi:NAD(P)-dependent dehydrogenase (short-subunit alcohol dehydrogenase family)